MKHTLSLLVLAVLASLATAAVVQPDAASRAGLNSGWISPGDRLLYRNYFYKAAVPNAIQSQDIIYRGNKSTRITAVQATEVGYSQYANAFIISGGVSRNNVTVRLQTARGYGYYYLVDIWGR